MTEHPAPTPPPHITAEWNALNVEERADILAWAADTANVDMTGDNSDEAPALITAQMTVAEYIDSDGDRCIHITSPDDLRFSNVYDAISFLERAKTHILLATITHTGEDDDKDDQDEGPDQ